MSRLEGKVAFISGVARGQGRSHAIRMAEEGAHIIGFDICDQIDSVAYAMPTIDDLHETARLVESGGGRILAAEADVRDEDSVQAVLDKGLAEFGRLDIVVANAGIMPVLGPKANTLQAWKDAIDVLLTGVYITVAAGIPKIVDGGRGGSVIITSSTAGLKSLVSGSAGSFGYGAAKHGVVGLMRGFATTYAAQGIRVNTVHPTGVNTPMVVNDAWDAHVAANPVAAGNLQNLLPVNLIEPVDISNAIVWLASDDARYVTGVTLPVDAGFTIR